MSRVRSAAVDLAPDASLSIYGFSILFGSNNPQIGKEIRDEIGFLAAPSEGKERVRFFFHDLSLPSRDDFHGGPLPLAEQVKFTEHLTGFFPRNKPLAWIEARSGYSQDEAVLASINSLANLISCALERSTKTLTFHAAVLIYRNKGLLLLGKSGAGKTTLSMICSREGFTCLTDEWAFVIPDPPIQVMGFPRRFRVHQEIVQAYTNRFPKIQGCRSYEAFGEKGMLLSPETLSRTFLDNPFPLHAILALNHHPEFTKPGIIPLGPSDALFELLGTFLGASVQEEGISARAVNRRGFEKAQEIIERFSVCRLDYNIYTTFREIPTLLKGLAR